MKEKFPTYKFGFLYGFNLSQQDFDKYILYFLITQVTNSCGFDSYFALWLLINSIITFPGSLFSGWITDYTEKIQNRTFQISILLQTLLQLAMILLALFPIQYSLLLISIAYQIRQVAVLQSATSMWKLVKIQLEIDFMLSHETQRDLLEENKIVSRCGNYGDLISDFCEVVALGALYFLSSYGYFDFFLIFIIISSIGLSFNIAALILSFTCHKIPDNFNITNKRLPQKHISDDEVLADPSPKEEDLILPDNVLKPKRSFLGKCRTIYNDIIIRFAYLYHGTIVLHALLHALLGLFVYNFVEYPVALGEAKDNTDHINKTPSSFCGGYLINLLMQGAILNISFFIGSILYALTLVKCPPKTYYKWVLPLLVIITACVIGVLLLDFHSHLLLSILIAIGQIIPYYQNTYDQYVFTTYVREEYYGFIYSLYNFTTQIIYNITAVLLSREIRLPVIIVICIVLLGLSVFYGFFIYRKFKNDKKIQYLN